MSTERVGLPTIVREWGRIGIIGFGGPPAHIALLRALCVDRREWLDAAEFEAGIAAVSLLPGPASTQLAIYCAWRLRRSIGAVVGGISFILPGLVVILGLSALFLEHHPPIVVLGLAAGAGAAVPAVALDAARRLLGSTWERARAAGATGEAGSSGGSPGAPARVVVYAAAGAALAATAGEWLAVLIFGCGLVEVAWRWVAEGRKANIAGLVWVAFKVGALSYGGGFVIVPLMQHDAVTTYHWLSDGRFLDAVALGQITPGPVVLTVAVIGYAASGISGGLIAAAVAFAPSFVFVLVGGPHLDRIRTSEPLQRFLTGAGASALGAIAGAAIPLAMALAHLWQVGLLAAALVATQVGRRSAILTLAACAGVGALAALGGAPTGHA